MFGLALANAISSFTDVAGTPACTTMIIGRLAARPIWVKSRQRVVIELRIQHRPDAVSGHGRPQQRVPVRRGFRRDIGRNRAAGAAAVFDDQVLPQRIGELLRDDPRGEIRSAARAARRQSA